MDPHIEYMQYFFQVYEKMVRQGPGSVETTLRSFNMLPYTEGVKEILEIGCGKGASCFTLAAVTKANITAFDNYKPFIDFINNKAKEKGLEDQIQGIVGSMLEMEFEENSFDLILSEGSAYFMGFEEALSEWKKYLKKYGCIIVSDAVWTTDSPTDESLEWWGHEYPDMATAPERIKLASDSGYEVVDSFIIPEKDWIDYYDDLDAQVAVCRKRHGERPAFADSSTETSYGRKHLHEFGYLCMVLKLK
jgi:SAM-dependent methyltransferase